MTYPTSSLASDSAHTTTSDYLGWDYDASSVFPPSLLFWQDVEVLPAMHGVAPVGEYAYAHHPLAPRGERGVGDIDVPQPLPSLSLLPMVLVFGPERVNPHPGGAASGGVVDSESNWLLLYRLEHLDGRGHGVLTSKNGIALDRTVECVQTNEGKEAEAEHD